MTLLAAGMMTDIACAADSPQDQALQIASLEKETSFTGYQSDLLDKKMLNKTVTESLRQVTWDDRPLQYSPRRKSTVKKLPSRLGGNK